MKSQIFFIFILTLFFSFSSCEKQIPFVEDPNYTEFSSDYRNIYHFDNLDLALDIFFSGIANPDINWSDPIPDNQMDLKSYLRMSSAEFENWSNAIVHLTQIHSIETEGNLVSYLQSYFTNNFSEVNQGEEEGIVTGATPCTDIYNATVAAASAAFAACILGTSGIGAALCGIGYGLAIFAAELSWCNCMNGYVSFEGC